MGRLIDGQRGVKGGRLEAFVPGSGHWNGSRVLVRARSRVTGYRSGAMVGNDSRDPLSDLVKGCSRRDWLIGPVRASLKGSSEAIGMVMVVGELPSFHAGEALEERV